MGGFLVRLEWGLGRTHVVGPDVGTSAALVAAATNPELVRSLAIGSGGTAMPLQVGGVLKEIIEAPDLEGYRQADSKQILGPVFDAIPGGPLPPEERADYLESYAGDRFAESARYVRTHPEKLPLLAERLAGIETSVLIVGDRDDQFVPPVNAEFLHARLPHSQLSLLPAGNFSWEEVPGLHGDVVLTWLSGGFRHVDTGNGSGEESFNVVVATS